jgi:RNA polymerase sigma-70 factor (ECF subfamily)
VDRSVTASFEELYADTSGDLLAFLLRRVEQPADAADLLSEVYLVAWRRRGNPPEQATLWLYGVAKNVLAAHRRRRASDARLSERLGARLVEQHVPQEGDLYVRQVLARLNRRDRELMELAVYEQLTPDEIARVVGRRAGTVRVQMHRARTKLEQLLWADADAAPAGGLASPRSRCG